MITTHAAIEDNIKRYKRGELIVPSDFRGKGTENAIKKTLSRLAADGTIKRLGHGLYVLPKKDPLFGEILPSTEEIAIALAKKEKVKIKPAGAFALHKLGLTLQVPTKLVYLTDGNGRIIKVGKNTIRFKSTTPKKMALKGELSGLIILALEELGTDQIDESTKLKLSNLLEKENPIILKQDLKLASAAVHDFILKLILNK
ncbi:hypothetical protein SAMN05421820_11130 [Pedobacter steynii]|uniref:Transcriptional regulator, AbiEi antitoxin, Type IV TA system n=1 Tax=Pedobacter steynii TaxID=430522 RepID=A0A1H0G3D8_9SPHI|nr:DUF6088 family protein [Pedobacter steynii]NQX42310.1 hypothetical protein [Pedobacter steynii]SDO01407.1 hypothetical protein SAMN05421820_11130 [Pedobacter steynii]